MQIRRALVWVGLALVPLLAGCIRPVYDEGPTAAPQEAATPTVTPIVVFEESPMPSPTEVALPPSVYLEPSVVSLGVGETAVVRLWIDSAQGVGSVLVELSFNPDYVQVDDADPAAEGVQISPGEIPAPAEVVRNEVTVEEDGRIVYQVAQADGAGIGSSGVIGSFVLRGVAEGGTPLRFENVAAYGLGGEEVAIMPLSDGLVTVGGGEAPVPPTAEGAAWPTVTPTAEATVEAEVAPTATSAPSVAGGGIYYVVQPGENLFRVGLKFGTTAEAIAAASGIADPDQVSAGAMVLVPVPPPSGGYGYYVQRGDTVYSIARRFGMEVEELVALNGIGPDYYIEVGQVLVVVP